MGREPGWKFYAALWVVMTAVHQDFWLWDSKRLVLGLLPVGLAYHAAYSLLACGVMLLLVRVAWPAGLERLDESEGRRS